MFGLIIAIISGALMSIQGVWNSGVTKQTSIWTAAGFVQFSALLVCVVAWFISGKEKGIASLLDVSPKYFLFGGILGAFITFTVIKSVELLGPAKSAMFIVTAQLIVSYLIEVFGLFGTEKVPFSWQKLCAAAVTIGGVIWFKAADAK
ncbi:MAG: DMT family transporter [Lachnospiraceae bacterium]|nr:DMT family transporter [Lachnospiraceae bacterium]